MARNRQQFAALERQTDRLGEQDYWFPLPALIVFGLAMILMGKILPGINPRVGHRARVLHYKAAEEPEGSIWIAVAPHDNNLIISTADKRQFRTSLKDPSEDEFRGLIDYLRNLGTEKIKDAALAGRAALHEFSVVLAVDERLRYAHIRNIIAALAQAGFSQYGFETLIMKQNHKYAQNSRRD